MKYICIGIIVLASVLIVASLNSEPIPESILKCIGYLTSPVFQDNVIINKPIGTCFVIGHKYAWDNTYKYMFLATAKHVLHYDNGTMMNKILLRMNDRIINRSADYDVLDKNLWFFHPDNAVDLAIHPLVPFRADFLYIPSNEFVTDTLIKTRKIGLGDDVFYAGLLPYYSGNEKIVPIARFGRIALVTDEKTEDGKYYYFIDSGNMPGHSGSPVFLWATPSRTTGQLVADARIFGLYGVVSGVIEYQRRLKFYYPKNTTSSPIPLDGMSGGVTTIVPVRYLNELLNDPRLVTILKSRSINRFKDGT